ncbi:YdcF family protein [Alsobacter sp. R-9]
MLLLLALLLTVIVATMAPRRLQPLAALGPAALLVALMLPPVDRELVARQWLESRYDRGAVLTGGPPVGILVPGGSVFGAVVDQSAGRPLDQDGRVGRVAGAAALAARFPQALVLHTGAGEPEAAAVFGRLGVGRERLIIEDRASNTYENAVFSAELLDPRPGQCWVVVSSAVHLPRAMATFREAGFDVVGYPVDYQRDKPAGHGNGVREVLAIIGYAVQGRLSLREVAHWFWSQPRGCPLHQTARRGWDAHG